MKWNRVLWEKIWQVFGPLFLFIICNDCIYLILERGKELLIQQGNAAGDFLLTYRAEADLTVQGLAVFLAFLVQYRAAVTETVQNTTEERYSWKLYLLLILEGAASAIILNLLFYLTGWTKNASFSAVADSQFVAGTGFEIAIFGILTPLVEEMIFRGIIFNRIHKWLGDKQTILLCAILFALYHFNPVQGLYAFLMGLLICRNYNRYRRISVAFAVHAAANVAVVLMAGRGRSF